VFRNLHFGINDLEAVVHHRYEAVRLVNQQLTNESESLCDELVAAVAVLVTAEVSAFSPMKSYFHTWLNCHTHWTYLCLIHTDGFLQALENNVEGASVHMRGLVNMVRMRGGLANFDHSPTLQRVITWYVIIVFGEVA
jgi:hypothetical protein